MRSPEQPRCGSCHRTGNRYEACHRTGAVPWPTGWRCSRCHRVWAPTFPGPCVCSEPTPPDQAVPTDVPQPPRLGPTGITKLEFAITDGLNAGLYPYETGIDETAVLEAEELEQLENERQATPLSSTSGPPRTATNDEDVRGPLRQNESRGDGTRRWSRR